MTDDDVAANVQAIVEEHGGFENLVEVRTVMEDGRIIITSADDAAEGQTAFGDDPQLARESTFTFHAGNQLTIQWGEQTT